MLFYPCSYNETAPRHLLGDFVPNSIRAAAPEPLTLVPLAVHPPDLPNFRYFFSACRCHWKSAKDTVQLIVWMMMVTMLMEWFLIYACMQICRFVRIHTYAWNFSAFLH